jgi:hypothetical protein
MFSREFEYTGYDGKPKKDTYWFNLTEAELYEIDLSSVRGFTAQMNQLLKEERTKEIVDAFKGIILSAVGVISADGRKFLKSEEIKEDFYRSKAYSILFVELVSSGEKVAEFLKGAIPDEIRAKMEENNGEPAETDSKVLDLPVMPKRNDHE